MMKRTLILLALASCLISCQNQEIDFPDFDYTTGYFPYQYPVRTIILGDYIYDNSNDNNHEFIVSAAMGGVHENTQQRIFKYVIDEDLCTNAFFEDGSPVRPLPASYYQLSDNEKIVIEPGNVSGGIKVKLSDDFFDNPLSITNTFVLPLRLTGVINLDTLLQGKAGSASADLRVAGDWSAAPKHFTMFGVKFINPYHGNYLYHGASSLSQNNTVLEDSTYKAKYIERNTVVKLTTAARTQVSMRIPFQSTSLTGHFDMLLNFESNNFDAAEGVSCTVTAPEGSIYTITGTGKYMSKTEEFGDKKRDAIYLSYTVKSDTHSYTASDTLIMRDRAVVMETYTPTIKN